MMIKNVFPAIGALLLYSVMATAQQPTLYSEHPDNVLLSNGWHLSPTGHSLPLGDLPLNLVVSPSKKIHGRYQQRAKRTVCTVNQY